MSVSAEILTPDAAQAASIALVEDRKKYRQAVFDHVIALRANRRQGTACAKTRGEVAGSNAKPWRQKGTGRARSGEKRSPIWRGGGVVFGPRPRDYSQKINRKVARAAFRKAFSERVYANDVVVVEDFAVQDGKTKSFIALIKEVADARKVFVLAPQFDALTLRSARNVGNVRLIRVADANTEDLLSPGKVVVTRAALGELALRMKDQ